MKRNIAKKIAALAITGLVVGIAWADTELIPFTDKTGTMPGCVGAYTGYAKYTNVINGAIWVNPPTNCTSCTFADASQFGSNYVSIATVTPFGQSTLCNGSNSITVTVTNTTKYEFIVFVKSPVPPPTNGQPMNLQVTW
jgi:hypothetical protein